MKHKFSKRYQAALLDYLKQGPGARLHPAQGMGQKALAAEVLRWPAVDAIQLERLRRFIGDALQLRRSGLHLKSELE